MKQKSISVFIPAYNEEENIEQAVNSINKYLKKTFSDFEFIVIDDGSTDNTLKKLKDLKNKKLVSKILHHKKNLGYGATLRDGFANAKKDLIFYTDADNQFDIQDLDKILPLISAYDIVSAYRIKRFDPPLRIFIAAVYNILLRFLFDITVKDIDSSFKLYKKKVFDNINLKARTGLIDAELLIKAKKKGFKIKQMGVNHYPRTKGRTIYEVGKRNTIFFMVKPGVIWDILKEIKLLWIELK